MSVLVTSHSNTERLYGVSETECRRPNPGMWRPGLLVLIYARGHEYLP